MTRRYGWILGLALLVFGRAQAQEPRREVPMTDPAPAAPVTTMPAGENVFVEPPAPAARSYAGIEVLQWWFKRDVTPILLLTGPPPSVPRPAGTLVGTESDPLMSRVFPGEDGLTYGTFSGLRANVGFMLDPCFSIEGNAFALERRRIQSFFAGNAGMPYLTRPFFDATGAGIFGPSEAAFETSTPPTGGNTGLNGNIAFDAESRFYGAELNAAYYPDASAGNIFKLLVGFRQLTLSESLRMTENLTPIQGGTALIGFLGRDVTSPAETVRTVDFFGTSNHFYGPQVGASFRWGHGPFAIDFLAKIAVGVNHETLNAAGATSLVTGGVVATTPGGVFATGTNSGFFSREELAVAPEAGIKMSLDICCWARMHAGYNLIYISSVVRPGTQIDRRLNPEQIPSDVSFTAGAPVTFPRGWFRDTDFYAHGVNLGLELMW